MDVHRLQLAQPIGLGTSAQFGIDPLDEVCAPASIGILDHCLLTGICELLGRIEADGLKEAVPGPAATGLADNERHRHQTSQKVKDFVTADVIALQHFAGGVKSERAGKDGQTPQEDAFGHRK